jgi:hypothetical protein
MLLFIKQARIFPKVAGELPEVSTSAAVTKTRTIKNSRVVNTGIAPRDK